LPELRHQEVISGTVEYGGKTFKDCRILSDQSCVKITSKASEKIQFFQVDGIYISFDGAIEILGRSKGGPHFAEIRDVPENLALAFISQCLLNPFASEFNALLEHSRELNEVSSTALFDIPVNRIITDTPEEKPLNSGYPSEEELQAMFYGMLEVLVEEDQDECVPVEYFYKALVLAWEAVGMKLVPVPTLVSTWMQARGMARITEGSIDAWSGIKLRPINYEIYQRTRGE